VAATLTQGRRLQEALVDSEARYRMLTDRATDIIVRYDRNGVIEFISPAIRHYGYEPEQMIGRNMAEFVHPDEGAATEAVRVAVTHGQPTAEGETHEFRAMRADGGWVWLQGNPSPIQDEAGEVIGAVSVLRDVSAAKAAEAALAASESRFRLLAQNSTDMIACCSYQGVLTYVSPAVKRILGYEPDELIGTKNLDLAHPDDAASVQAAVLAMFAARRPDATARIEYRLRKKNGDYLWIESNPSLVINPDTGRIVELQDCSRDISSRKALELELMRKQVEAEAATVAKSEFLANMSHEIRTPLTAILGFGALLEEVEGLPPKVNTFVDRITTASQTLLAVVNDVLDFSKVDAGQIVLDPQAFDPAAFLAGSLELVAGQAARKGLSLDGRIDGAFPPAVRADSARLRQVLLNLLTNAIKFTDHGGVTVRASYEPAGGGRLRFEVADTGVGIPAELSHRLFQRFSQIDGSITRQYGGTGLGLAICKGLVELMGGDIGLQTREGEGSTFWFTIAAPPAELAEASADPVPAEFHFGAIRILLVDDVDMNRELVAAMLSPFDITLTEASGGLQAVEAAMQSPFDVILMDLQMPGMDGLAAARAIRARSGLNRATPILALSANVLPVHLAACREAGMNDHIGKPIRIDDLLEKVAFWTDPSHGPADTAEAS
jgi:PAS domain S-box-containing protein